MKVVWIILVTLVLCESPNALANDKACEDSLLSWYAPIEHHLSGYLPVGEGHEIYYDVSGNPRGKPVVWLHGGPGGSADPSNRQIFDPKKYLIILFDQRGGGRSQFDNPVRGNDLPAMINDMEALRRHLNLEKWMVTGHSWGALLALAYAEAHPDRVSELLLFSLFIPQNPEPAYVAPGISGDEAWHHFTDWMNAQEKSDILKTYARAVLGRNRARRNRAIRGWMDYHMGSHMDSSDQVAIDESWPMVAIDVKFASAGYYATESQLIAGAKALNGVPTTIVHSTHDPVCSIDPVRRLSHAWPEAKFFEISDDTHSMSHPDFIHQVISATKGSLRQVP